MSNEEQHAGSATVPVMPPSKPEAEKESEPEEKKEPAKKAKRMVGQYSYIGQDDNRFLFQDRGNKKCYTVDKSQLRYRGENGFRKEILDTLHK